MRGWVIRILICLLMVGWTLYLYIDQHNDLTELRIRIPKLEKEVRAIHEENRRLQYEVDRFESPIHLMELARKPEFGHLKFPHTNEVIILSEDN